jgi:parvulin-like peptidyl-prolyl isomerase
MDTHTTRRRTRWLLGVGAGVGLATAAASLLGAGESGGLPSGAVAVVNDVPIRADEYWRVVAALASDRRNALAAEDRRRVLDRLIEEELLVQHALSLGLVRSDRRVRAGLVSAVLGAVSVATDGYEPDEAEVEAFYRENRDYFAGPGRLWVRQVFVAANGAGDEDARARAQRAAERLRAGEDLARVREELGDEEIAPLPDTALPPAKLREYLGPTALRAAMELEVGASSGAIRSAGGYRVLRVMARDRGGVSALDEIEPQVRAEMRRREGDRALREQLDRLRAQADVRVTADLEALPGPGATGP